MNLLKLIIACAIIIGLTQLELDGGAPQRKYYTGRQVIEQRQNAAAAGNLPQAGSCSGGSCSSGACSGGSCPFVPKSKPTGPSEAEVAQQAEKDALQALINQQKEQMEAQAQQFKQLMEAQAKRLADLEEQLRSK